MVIHAGAEEGQLILGARVTRRQRLELLEDLELGLAGVEPEWGRQPQVGGDVGEQLLDRLHADRPQHLAAVRLRRCGVPTHDNVAAYAAASSNASCSLGSDSLTLTSHPSP